MKHWSRALLTTTALTAALLAFAPNAAANPQGGVVSAGQASISESGKKLDVNQQSNKAVIDWRGFDIAPDETTQFTQPSSSSIALNRVNSNSASRIDGNLTANGNVVIVNQNGVMFGKTAKVDVNGLVATTADIDNDTFMNNDRLVFDKPGKPDAAVVNEGQITAKEAGLVGLVAPNVVNSGTITAKLGKVHLASGDAMTVDMYGDGIMDVAVSDQVKSQLVSNSGTIQADGGKIALTAAAGKQIVNSLITNTGALQSRSVAQKNGKIIIAAEGSNAVAGNVAADKGKKQGSSTVLVSGVLDVSGRKAGERGGKVTVTGDNVALLDGTFIDASGYEGKSGTTVGKEKSSKREGSAGGEVLIGGDYLGSGDTPTAKNLYVDPGVLVLNDALNSGDAGRTIFWSDGNAAFYGNVYARALGGKPVNLSTWHATAGGNAGDGGFVETSGHEHLDAGGYVDLTASNGARGTYFLDPTDITIYGNVDPAFQSTDGTAINLATNLKLWLDASDTSKVNLTYNSMSTTVTGSPASNQITVGSATGLIVGARIRLNGAGSVTGADTLGNDTYTITAISGTTITLSSNLTSTYTGNTVYQGYISQLTDKSTAGNNVTQSTPGNMPLWISNGQNGLGIARFDGSNDDLTVAMGTLLQNAHTAFLSVTPLANGAAYNPVFGYTNSASNQNGGGMVFFKNNGTLASYPAFTGGGSFDGLSSWTSNQAVLFALPIASNTTNTFYKNGAAVTSFNSATLSTSNTHLALAHQGGSSYFSGNINDVIFYNTALPTNARNLVEQYQSAKWGITLTPPGTGATEVAKATASDGYSVFTTRYLERLSQSADISLQATNNINFDLKGDTLALASDRNFSLTTTNGNIGSASTGAIITTRTGSGGNITMTAGGGGTIDVSNLTLNANGGGTVSLLSAGAMTLGTINASSILARTTGASSDITIPSGKVLTASGSGTPLTLAAGRNFINSAGSGALSAASGRWLVYSANPASDTIGSLSNSFRRFTCAYGGSCPTLGSGNGLLYSYTPTLTATPNNLSAITYGDAVPSLTGYAYTLTGYLGSDSGSDNITGSLTGSTTYTQGSNVGSYNVNYSSGSLASAMGYGFSYANNASAIAVTARALSVAADAKSKTYGAADPSLTYQITSGSLYGADSFTGALSRAAGETVAGGPYAISQNTLSAGSNYTISYTGANLTINPYSLNVTADAKSKTYGAADPTLTYTYGSLQNGDTSSIFTGALARAAGETVAGGPYAISQNTLSAGSNYTINYTGANLTINPKTLTAGLTGTVSKTYNGDNFASLATGNYTLSGVIGGDSVMLNSPVVGTYDNKNAGTGKTVSVAGLALAGGDAGNYQLASNSISGAVGTILAKALSILGVSGTNKVYDATTAGNITGTASLSGVVSGDTVNLDTSGASASFAHKNVGTSKTVTFSGYTINGADAGNYSLSQPSNSTADITAKALSITGVTANNKVYDRTTAATLNNGSASLSGIIGGDAVSLDSTGYSASFADWNVGAGKSIIASGYALGGADSSNYSLTQPTGLTATIMARFLTVTADNKSKAYGAADPSFTYSYTGLASGDGSADFTGALARITGENAGTYAINQGTLSTYGNYAIGTFNAGALAIDPAAQAIILPDTVVRVSQTPTINIAANAGVSSFTSGFTSAPSVPLTMDMGSPVSGGNAPVPALSTDTNSTPSAPAEPASPSNEQKEERKKPSHEASVQSKETGQGKLKIDPALAKRFALNDGAKLSW